MMINDLAHSYSEYMQVDANKEITAIEDTLHEMMTKLEDIQNVTDMIRGESLHCLGKTVPEIHVYAESVHQLFQRIDNLETFVTNVKGELEAMEKHLDEAESVVGPESSLKTILKPLFFKKSTEPPGGSGRKTPKTPSYEAPKIFHAADYFSPTETNPNPPLGATTPGEESKDK